MSNVLVIPDLHAPFIADGALRFVKSVQKKYRCNQVVFLGDIIDAYAFSTFRKDPDSMSAGLEWERALKQLQPWYKAFSNAKICYGNHDIRAYKRVLEAGVPERMLKSLETVLECPTGWEFAESREIDGVLYEHGDAIPSGSSRPHTVAGGLAGALNRSVVFGHYHSAFSLTWLRNRRGAPFFGMCLGCLVDEEAYAFKYARKMRPSQFGCGVVLNGAPQLVPWR